MPHSERPKLAARTPVHVTIKLRKGLPSLRAQLTFARVRALLCTSSSAAFRIVQWSVQADHTHLIVEAENQQALSRAMARFDAALARVVNRIANRKGSALRERYHARPLRTPRETHHALRYVLLNGHKHGAISHGVDPMSSGEMFDGWSQSASAPVPLDASVRAPRTWLLRVGWRRRGLVVLC